MGSSYGLRPNATAKVWVLRAELRLARTYRRTVPEISRVCEVAAVKLENVPIVAKVMLSAESCTSTVPVPDAPAAVT
jgi:hypothetical protein